MKEKIACIGAGTVGRGWATLFAMNGYQVSLYDLSPTVLCTALEAIDQSLQDLYAMGKITDVVSVRECITTTQDMTVALQGAVYAQENIPEIPELKKEIFSEMDKVADTGCILASSTSEIPGSIFCADLDGRDRCLVAHPLNPPYLIPLVEICPTPWTSAQTIKKAREVLEGAGQAPIVVNKEVSGFIANRLQLAVLGEALHLVGEGFCSAEDIDIAMKKGLARRWAVIGPFETGHLNASGGYKAYLNAYEACHRKIIDNLNLSYEWSEALINQIHDDLCKVTAPEDVSSRQAWRDRRLMTLSSHLEGEEKSLD